MPTPSATPSLGRLTALALGALGAGTALFLVAVPAPPRSASEAFTWWESVGTPTATIAIVRSLGLLVAVWLVGASLAGLTAAVTDSVSAARVFARATPASLRRVLLASAVAAAASTPGVSLAADPPAELPVLRDIGPAGADDDGAVDEVPVLADVGPASAVENTPESSPGEPVTVDPTTRLDTWTVARGDHLWRVAEETLRDRGEWVDDATTATYWRELISINRDAIGPDPDLILPGVVLTLPG